MQKMKLITSVIFSLFIVGIYAATTGIPPAAITTVLPLATTKPTTANPVTDSTTTELSPTTESSSTTSSTTSSTSTTPETSSTTTTTESTTTTTTTVAPTPAPAPTPSPSPSPKPSPPTPAGIGRYAFTDDKNNTCILVEFAVQLNVSVNAPANESGYFTFNMPKTDENSFQATEGSCGNGTSDQYMLIKWKENDDWNTLNLTFSLNQTAATKEFALREAEFNLSAKFIPYAKENVVLYHVGDAFKAPKDRAYHCTRPDVWNLTETDDAKSKQLGTVSVSHVLLEAYNGGKNKQFSSPVDCDAINTPDIVPIAVGIALIALVVVVLIAYLVGRRRAQQRGYVSM